MKRRHEKFITIFKLMEKKETNGKIDPTFSIIIKTILFPKFDIDKQTIQQLLEESYFFYNYNNIKYIDVYHFFENRVIYTLYRKDRILVQKYYLSLATSEIEFLNKNTIWDNIPNTSTLSLNMNLTLEELSKYSPEQIKKLGVFTLDDFIVNNPIEPIITFDEPILLDLITNKYLPLELVKDPSPKVIEESLKLNYCYITMINPAKINIQISNIVLEGVIKNIRILNGCYELLTYKGLKYFKIRPFNDQNIFLVLDDYLKSIKPDIQTMDRLSTNSISKKIMHHYFDYTPSGEILKVIKS